MTSNIVYDGVQRHGSTTAVENTLFAGQKLFFAQRIPQRTWLIENAISNGAVIVKMDTDADVRLVDDARKGNAPGTHSFKYVIKSIENGVREDLAKHAVGIATRVSRPVGSTATAPKQGRTPFTNEDDQQLWDWLKPYEESGGTWKGNEIYKQLESVNPRHTYQSWRDRWIKYTRFQNRTTTTHVDEGQQQEEEEEEEEDEEQNQPKSETHLTQQRKRRRLDVNEAEQQETTGGGILRSPTTIKDSPHARRSDQAPGDSPTRVRPSQSNSKQAKKKEQSESSLGKRSRVEALEIDQDNDPRTLTEREGSNPSEIEYMRQHFPREARNQLYRLVPKLAILSPEKFQDAWADLVSSEDWNELSPKEGQIYFAKVIVPEYCRRNEVSITEIAPYLTQQQDFLRSSNLGKATESNARIDDNASKPLEPGCGFCHKTTSASWHRHKRYTIVCTECAVFFRVERVPRPSTSLADFIENPDSRIPFRETTDSRTPVTNAKLSPTMISASKRVFRGTSLIISDQDPGPSAKASSQRTNSNLPTHKTTLPSLARVPESNEARKRGSARGSQSQSTSQESQPPAWEAPPSLDPMADLLEEQTIPISAQLVRNNKPEVVLTSPASSSESTTRVLATKVREPRPRHEPENFDTAPETFDEFDSALEEQPLGRSSRPVGVKERRLSTQALFNNNSSNALDLSYLELDLPEPEGGWQQALGYDPDAGNNDDHQSPDHSDQARSRIKGKGKAQIKDKPNQDPLVADLHVPAHSKKMTSTPAPPTTHESSGLHTSLWLAAQEAVHTDVHRLTLKSILFKVLEATSFDFKLATEVVVIVLDQLSPKYKRRDKFAPDLEVTIPTNLPGVWTSEDDNLLLSPDSNDIKTVLAKHGQAACDVRLILLAQFLER